MTISPMPVRVEAEIVANSDEGGGNWRLVLCVPQWPGSHPGQFVMLSPGAHSEVLRTDPLLPRPMAVYRTRASNADTGGDGSEAASRAEVDVLYKVTGRGTALLAAADPGQRVRVVGPLGVGFPDASTAERAVLVGGGTGIASLFEFAEQRASAGAEAVVLLGGRRADDLMGRSDFEGLAAELRVSTEDGSLGHHGRVTELLEALLADGRPSRVYACGPTPMMRRCAEVARAHGTTCHVSLENGMACGFGVCLGCAVPRASEGYALVCRDGPVFDAEAIRWEGLP